jgi:hypothetical protein
MSMILISSKDESNRIPPSDILLMFRALSRAGYQVQMYHGEDSTAVNLSVRFISVNDTLIALRKIENVSQQQTLVPLTYNVVEQDA